MTVQTRRNTQAAPLVPVEIMISTRMHERMGERAKKAGQPLAVYARLLLEAAWSARCGPTGDDALDAAVASIPEAGPAPKIEPAPPVKVDRPERKPPPIIIPEQPKAPPAPAVEVPAPLPEPPPAPAVEAEPEPARLRPLSIIQVRLVKNLRAAGNMPPEIARLTGFDIEQIRDIVFPHRSKK